ncbi:MAG: helix-turn-helix domain-containing protein [Candidatus Micrarchaeota archaeon]
MKFCEMGVYHHDCWFTDAIEKFPELQVKEISARVCKLESGTKINTACYRLFSPKKESLDGFVKQIVPNVSGAKLLSSDGSVALLEVSWRAPKTSYDTVLASGCSTTSSCYAKDGYETYSLFTEDPTQIKKLFTDMNEIGEVKIFGIKNEPKNNDNYGLTPKQRQALASAVSMGYYEWPKKVNLEELASRLGIKRRALQENLRKAEGRVLQKLLDELTS